MLYSPATTPEQLLAALPDLLDNLEEAAELLEYEKQHGLPDHIVTTSDLQENSTLYTSVREAFEELYPDSIDDFKAEKCEDYQLIFTDFSHFYINWLESNCTCIWLSSKKFIILDD